MLFFKLTGYDLEIYASTMETASNPYRVHQCSNCPRDKEYYCKSCKRGLCSECKENHVKDIKTHNVVGYREKFKYVPKREICAKHPKTVYTWYCDLCQVPACYRCKTHRKHIETDIITAYRKKQQKLKGTVQIIRSESLVYTSILLSRAKNVIKAFQAKVSIQQADMLKKAQRLKFLIDSALCDIKLKHSCLKQKMKQIKKIACIQKYEHISEQSMVRPLRFFLSLKRQFPKIVYSLHARQHIVTELLNKEVMLEPLSFLQIVERGRRRRGDDCLLKLVSVPEFYQSLTVKGIDCCHHISCKKSGRAWVSGFRNNLILTNTTGKALENWNNELSDFYRNGLHTVNSEDELIYIACNYNINKISRDMKITTMKKMKMKSSSWEPRCVCWSPSTGDLLVGMLETGEILDERNGYSENTGLVIRYDKYGKLKQIIQHTNTGLKLFSEPKWITENHNGDIVVSDDDSAVVVTDRSGEHRFSYTALVPQAICTDMFSNILVCDWHTKTVHIIDMNGQFLLNFSIRPLGKYAPQSVGYDANTHRLWVGSGSDNKVCIYRYID